jgi:hypothetical protein
MHDRRHLYRAILEGIAFEQRLHTEGVEAATGTPVTGFAVMGGGSRSALWRQIIADVTGKPVYRCASPEASALGAAMLAAAGAGLHPDARTAATAMSRIEVIPAASCSTPSDSLAMSTCTCMSHMPGMSAFPFASITRAPRGGVMLASGPTAVMRSPVNTTVVPGRVSRVSLSKSVARRMTSAGAAAGELDLGDRDAFVLDGEFHQQVAVGHAVGVDGRDAH